MSCLSISFFRSDTFEDMFEIEQTIGAMGIIQIVHRNRICTPSLISRLLQASMHVSVAPPVAN